MGPATWPEGLEHIWAKGRPKGKDRGESLAQHTWNVLSRMADMMRLHPELPERCGFPSLWQVLFWSALLHDWGKVAGGFQAMLRGGKTWRHRHEVLSLVFLDWVTGSLNPLEEEAIVAAVVSHHKDAAELIVLYPLRVDPGEDPLADLLLDLPMPEIQLLRDWLIRIVPEWAVALGLEGMVRDLPSPGEGCWQDGLSPDILPGAALAALRPRLFRYFRLVRGIEDGEKPQWVLPGILLRGCLVQADHLGSAHAGTLRGFEPGVESTLRSLGLDRETLYDHQRQALETEGAAMLLAPTGSGKTEAAMLWAARQREVSGSRRIYYALPYQASMNAMYDRLNGIFPGDVGLTHGRSAVAIYRRLMDQDYSATEASARARTERDLAAMRFYPIQVYSPYQMLKTMYRLKGYEAMLADYSSSLVVLDEIHAYEPERLAIILETGAFLRERMGARFLVMSATMPECIQRRVVDSLGVRSVVRASPALFRQFTRHRPCLLPGELVHPDNLTRVARCFDEGKSVLVTCNTVSGAQGIYQWLKDHIPKGNLVLVHGRFNGRDRIEKEKAINERAGLESLQRDRVVVVSTQVVEVSLNIDLDVLFTEPAPLEALLQRFGRVNRKRRTSAAPVYVFEGPSDGQGVYMPEMVGGALVVLGENNGVPLDEQRTQSSLDQIYQGRILENWEARYSRTAASFHRAFSEAMIPFSSDEASESIYDRLFDGTEVLPAALEPEYRELGESSPLEAAQLLVPISWNRWMSMWRLGLVVSPPGKWPPVVDVPYSPDSGLSPALEKR